MSNEEDTKPKEGALRGWSIKGAEMFGVSLIAAALTFAATARNGDIVAWLEKHKGEDAKDFRAPPAFSDVPAESLVFLTAQITNAGKTSIGEQDARWTLTIRGPAGTKLARVGDVKPSSRRMVVVPQDSPSTDKITIQLGCLEPRDFLDVPLALAPAPVDSYPDLKFETSLVGLSDPISKYGSPALAAGAKMLPFLFVFLYALLMYEAIRDRHDPKKGPKFLEKVQHWRARLAGKAVLGLFMAFFVAGCFALGFGWVAATLWQIGVL
jgi:hypothetical protein